MNHKRIIGIACAIVLSVSAFTGCKSTQAPPPAPGQTNVPPLSRFDITNAAIAIEGAAEVATLYAIQENPDTRKYFVAAVTALDLALDGGTISPQEVREAIAQNFEGDAGQEAWLAIVAGLNIYRAYGARVVSERLDQVQYLRPVLMALRTGILHALTGPPAPGGKVAGKECSQFERGEIAVYTGDRTHSKALTVSGKSTIGPAIIASVKTAIEVDEGVFVKVLDVPNKPAGEWNLMASHDGGRTWGVFVGSDGEAYYFDASDLVIATVNTEADPPTRYRFIQGKPAKRFTPKFTFS